MENLPSAGPILAAFFLMFQLLRWLLFHVIFPDKPEEALPMLQGKFVGLQAVPAPEQGLINCTADLYLLAVVSESYAMTLHVYDDQRKPVPATDPVYANRLGHLVIRAGFTAKTAGILYHSAVFEIPVAELEGLELGEYCFQAELLHPNGEKLWSEFCGVQKSR